MKQGILIDVITFLEKTRREPIVAKAPPNIIAFPGFILIFFIL